MMTSLRSEKVRIVVVVLLLISMQWLIIEGKVYILNLNLLLYYKQRCILKIAQNPSGNICICGRAAKTQQNSRD